MILFTVASQTDNYFFALTKAIQKWHKVAELIIKQGHDCSVVNI